MDLGARGDAAPDRHQPRQRRELRRVRILVRPHQSRCHRRLHRDRRARHPRLVPGLRGQRRRATCGNPTDSCANGYAAIIAAHAGDDVLVHGHRDRHHRRSGVARPRERDSQGGQLGDLAHQHLLHRLDLRRRGPGSVQPARRRLVPDSVGGHRHSGLGADHGHRGAHRGRVVPELGALHRLPDAVLARRPR